MWQFNMHEPLLSMMWMPLIFDHIPMLLMKGLVTRVAHVEEETSLNRHSISGQIVEKSIKKVNNRLHHKMC